MSTGAERIADLQALLARAEAGDAWMKGHPGVVKALGAFLAPLARVRVQWAVDLQKLLNDAPGELADAKKYLPEAIFMLEEIQPAATGIPGGWSGARGHIL